MKKPATDPMEKTEMKPMKKVLDDLLSEGFSTQFKAMERGLKSLSTNKTFQPHEVKIVNFYRFEGESDPADSSILYAIETNDGEKGTLTDSYGPYGDTNVTKFIQQVENIHKDVQ